MSDIENGSMCSFYFSARIYGFNVKENKSSSKSPDVQLTLDNVIYDLFDNVVDDIKEVMPTFEAETEIGKKQEWEEYM